MRVSAVIPTLNEERTVGPLIRELLNQGACEVIVADGGSLDQTVEIARAAGAKVVATSPGRGGQLNAGAAEAKGEVLFFVHADVLLPDGAVQSVSRAMNSGAHAGGAFSIAADSERPTIRFIFAAANMRSRLLKLPYGDQCLFVSRSEFEALGGFKNIPLMEDVDFVRRLNRRGATLILPQKVTASARRYQGEGALFTAFRNILLLTLYFSGVNPSILMKFYPHMR